MQLKASNIQDFFYFTVFIVPTLHLIFLKNHILIRKGNHFILILHLILDKNYLF